MTHDRIEQADLDWWLELAPTLEWTFARTYAESAPHSYVVLGRTERADRGRLRARGAGDPHVRASGEVLRHDEPLSHQPGRFAQVVDDGPRRHQDEPRQPGHDRSRVYGVQNAPSTESGIATPYDAIATTYDSVHPTSVELERQVREAVASLAGEYPPSVLDVGCGTGRLLDLGVTKPDRYAGVDTSAPMLNQLVRKHPGVGGALPGAGGGGVGAAAVHARAVRDRDCTARRRGRPRGRRDRGAHRDREPRPAPRSRRRDHASSRRSTSAAMTGASTSRKSSTNASSVKRGGCRIPHVAVSCCAGQMGGTRGEAGAWRVKQSCLDSACSALPSQPSWASRPSAPRRRSPPR